MTFLRASSSPIYVLPTLVGERLRLRAPRPSDARDRQAAGRDPEFRRMVGAPATSSADFSQADAQQWLHQVSNESHSWVMDFERHCIGVARLHNVDQAARRANLAIGIFSPIYRGRGLGTEGVQLLVRHAFDTMALATLRLRVLAFNTPAIACYQRCSFREMGREQISVDGTEVTDLIMELHRSDRPPIDGSVDGLPRSMEDL